MPVVSGDLKIVTNTPSRVTEVWVRAKGLRPHGSGVVLEEQDRKPVEGGHVSFEALAGPAVLTLVGAGQTVESVGLIVPDSPTATLADCVRNAEMAGDRDASELAGILEQIRGSVGASAEARAGAEAAAVDAAGSAVSAGRDAARAEAAAGEAATEAAGLAADAVRLAVKEDADRSAAGATTSTEKAAEAAGSATRAETAEAGAVEAEEGAEAGQELSEDAAAVAVAAAIGVQAAFHQYAGAGFPEGKVTAPVGSIYVDTAATAGAVRWIKASGTGNTGWAVEYGDTGWRDITDQYSANAGESGVLALGAGAKILIRRTSGDVYFRLAGPITARSTYGSIVQLLTGWRPEVDTEVALSRGLGIRHTRYWITLEGATSGATIANSGRSVVGQWPTMEPWPSTLPGTPS